MLILSSNLDIDNRAKCILGSYVAFDPANKYYLRRSNGNRKAGRPARYYVHISNTITLRFTAYSDTEAVEKANKMLERNIL